MRLQVLTEADISQWANLLAICFGQPYQQMVQIIQWIYCLGKLEAYGLWDAEKLVSQYAVLHRAIYLHKTPIQVGLSMNMAVHPDYRGQGLIKQVSRPVYDSLQAQGILFGMGFSNAQGVKVDKRSKGYGYRVIGQMQSLVTLRRSFNVPSLNLSDTLPSANPLRLSNKDSSRAHFTKDLRYLLNRYTRHPKRRYHYGIWNENESLKGIVVYKHVKLRGVSSVALLDVYSNHVAELLMRWSTTLKQENIKLIHTLISPNSTIKTILSQYWFTVTAPLTRNPYYLTIKPLQDTIDNIMLDFAKWELIGGDVL